MKSTSKTTLSALAFADSAATPATPARRYDWQNGDDVTAPAKAKRVEKKPVVPLRHQGRRDWKGREAAAPESRHAAATNAPKVIASRAGSTVIIRNAAPARQFAFQAENDVPTPIAQRSGSSDAKPAARVVATPASTGAATPASSEGAAFDIEGAVEKAMDKALSSEQ
jgi:hypothetical protein